MINRLNEMPLLTGENLDPIAALQIHILRTLEGDSIDGDSYYSYRKADLKQLEIIFALGNVPVYGKTSDYLADFSTVSERFDPNEDISMLHVLTHCYGLIKTSQGVPWSFKGFDKDYVLFSCAGDDCIVRVPVQSLNSCWMQYILKNFNQDLAAKLIEMQTNRVSK